MGRCLKFCRKAAKCWWMADEQYTILQFDKALHDRSAFTCGIAKIDNWLKNSISKQIKENRLRVWCANDADGELVGFYSLCTHSICPEKAPALAAKREQNEIPTLYLPVIATAKNRHGNGIGSSLMGHAIIESIKVSEKVGVAALVLDVKEDEKFQKRMEFYTSLGFRLIGCDNKRVFLSIKDAKASL